MRSAKHNQNLKRKIVELSRDVRKKYKALKLGKSEEDESIRRLFQPISEPLREIVIQKNEKKEIKKEIDDDDSSTMNKIKTEDNGEDDNNFKEQESDINLFEQESDIDLFEQYPEISRIPVQRFWSKSDDIDFTYGPIYDSVQSQWRIGNKLKLMNFDKNNGDVIIDNTRFRGSSGLYNLIFYKNPVEYTENDLKEYKKLLNMSNAHRDAVGRLKGSNMPKYTRIIKPLFSKTQRSLSTSSHVGQSLHLTYNTKPIEYVYWDNINELVDRLRLLIASQAAGNTSHNNEIVAIVNELKEAGVIQE